MKIMKLIMGSICLALFCTSAAWVEYKIVSSLGSVLSLCALTSMSAAILVALLRANVARIRFGMANAHVWRKWTWSDF